jgi:hypothetical protein
MRGITATGSRLVEAASVFEAEYKVLTKQLSLLRTILEEKHDVPIHDHDVA